MVVALAKSPHISVPPPPAAAAGTVAAGLLGADASPPNKSILLDAGEGPDGEGVVFALPPGGGANFTPPGGGGKRPKPPPALPFGFGLFVPS